MSESIRFFDFALVSNFVNCQPKFKQMTFLDKLAAIRKQMQQDNVAAYIISSADPHISEYLPDRYKCIAFASGFTGSAGTLVITHDFAGLWTDARYFVQGAEQLEGSGFELVKLNAQAMPEYIDWLIARLPAGATVAFDANIISVQLAQLLEQSFAPLSISVDGGKDYLDAIWEGRAALPTESAFLLEDSITGKSIAAKLMEVRAMMQKHRASVHFVSSLDDIAWLFNIRGCDVHCNPVVLAFALITADSCTLYIDLGKLNEQGIKRLTEAGVQVASYVQAGQALAALKTDETILIDPKRTCFAMFSKLPNGIKIVLDVNPSTVFKGVKNAVEQEHTRHTMVRDGVALTKFFKWLEEQVDQEEITEVSLAKNLRDFRAEQVGFVGESFDTIAGYKEHGALPHYKATPESDVRLTRDGLFLLDSGGQYQTGTTDITRVVSMGNITDAQRKDYTLVLKAMIEGSTVRFPKGTKGYQIDAVTRRPMWEHGLNYGHGTGHGVGFFLNVHEGPQVFNPSNLPVAVELGMITSIEPGLYRPQQHGIRIENLVLTVADQVNEFGEFYAFETLTICYIATDLVDSAFLDEKHITWLNNYNRWVYEKLSPSLSPDEAAWLKHKTKAI